MKQKDRETWRDGMGRDNEQKCLAGWDGTGQNIGGMQDGTDGFLVVPRSSGNYFLSILMIC